MTKKCGIKIKKKNGRSSSFMSLDFIDVPTNYEEPSEKEVIKSRIKSLN